MSDDETNLPPIHGNENAQNNRQPALFKRGYAQPLYVKHTYPEVYRERKNHHDYLPKLPRLPGGDGAAEEHYGLMYHKPETEAEIRMNDLWVSKRREEAFQWKAKQQMALMMDRMSLHKSRMESDLLSRYVPRRRAPTFVCQVRRHLTPPSPLPTPHVRQETQEYLRDAQTRPRSAAELRSVGSRSPSPDARTVRSASATYNRFAPVVDPSARRWRVLSGRISARQRRAGKYGDADANGNGDAEADIDAVADPAALAVALSSGEEDAALNVYEDDDEDDAAEVDLENAIKQYDDGNTLKGVTTVEVGDTTLVQSSRKDVKRPSKSGPAPFRFSRALPLSYKQEFYMELSSEDDDDDENNNEGDGEGGAPRRRRPKTAPVGGNGGGGAAGDVGAQNAAPGGGAPKPKPKSAGGNNKKGDKNAAVKPTIFFKRDRPENYERPVSSTLMREMAEADPELKVLYRYTTFRRMPLTARQEQWLQAREEERAKESYEVAKKLVEDHAAKEAKKKEKGAKDGKGGKKDDKKDKGGKGGKKDDKKAKEEAAKAALLAKPPPPKYKSATQFMQIHFPNFDADEEEDRVESCGPMKVL